VVNRRPGGQSVGPPGPCSNSPRAGVGGGSCEVRGRWWAGTGARRQGAAELRAAQGPSLGPPRAGRVDVDSGRSAGARAPRGGERGVAGIGRGDGARDESGWTREEGGSAGARIVRGGGRRPGGQSVGPPGPCSNSPRAGVGRGILRGVGAVVGGDRCSAPGRCGTARGPGALPRAAQGLPCARG
jgi:hypothetical protein